MNSITKLFDKYKTFEENLKQERFWLFIPVYLVKTAIKYVITLSCSYYLFIIVGIIIDLIVGFNENNIIQGLILAIPACFGSSVIFTILFSRNKLSIHPLWVTYLYFIIFFYQSNLMSYIVVFLASVILVLIFSLGHYILLKHNKKSFSVIKQRG